MIRSLQDLRRYVRADAASRQTTRLWRSFLIDPVFRFTVYLRFNEYLINIGLPKLIRLVPLFMFRRLSIRLGFSIPPNVFGPGLAIVHYGLIVVNPAVRVGANCRMHAGINIGGAEGLTTVEKAALRCPTIGKNCYIGPGAKIFGPIKIGDNCAIAANAVVNKSFGNNKTLGGVPARVISEKGSKGLIHDEAATTN